MTPDTAAASSPTIPLQAPPVIRRLMRNQPGISLHGPNSPDRAASEAYIRDTFRKIYGATVTTLAPLLLEVRCAGNISGAVGIRPASENTLFVEQYLDEPAHKAIHQITQNEIRRDQVAEICNLAALRPGACQLITLVLAGSLYAAGYRFAILAGTAQLARILTRQNYALRHIAAANPARLGGDAESWGSYYQTSPGVFSVDIEATCLALKQNLLPAAMFEFLDTRIEALGNEFAATRFCRLQA